jgi:hypothetical protein
MKTQLTGPTSIIQLPSTISYKPNTYVKLEEQVYIVTACVNLGWVSSGEWSGYHLVLTPVCD